jgi:hypothetical protein
MGLGKADPANVVLAMEREDGSFEAGTGFTVLGWACGNCGFIRLHSLEVLESTAGTARVDALGKEWSSG